MTYPMMLEEIESWTFALGDTLSALGQELMSKFARCAHIWMGKTTSTLKITRNVHIERFIVYRLVLNFALTDHRILIFLILGPIKLGIERLITILRTFETLFMSSSPQTLPSTFLGTSCT